MTFKAQWYRDKFAKKRGKGFCGYPVATVAFYGSDDTRATKVSVCIVAHEGADTDPVERWFCKTTGTRIDPEVTEAIVRFIDHHGVKSVVAVDRIIGCPHEEGIDYPEGENARSVRSGPTVIGGAARSSSETLRGKRFHPHAKAFLTRLIPTVVMHSLTQDTFWTRRSHVALSGARPSPWRGSTQP